MGGGQTDLYKLQSYSIYEAQTEPEPWGTQDGSNLQSRFAWSYAAFESSDTAGGVEREIGRDGELHLYDRYHHCFPHHSSILSAPIRVRFIPEGPGVKVFLILPRPDSPKEAFRVQVFVPPTLGSFIPSPLSTQVIPNSFPLLITSEWGRGRRGFEVLKMFLPGRRRKLPLGCPHRCWRMHKDMDGCRDQKDHEKLVTKGWQL